MKYAFRTHPVKVMHHNIASICAQNGIHLFPRSLKEDKTTLVYSKVRPRRQEMLKPLVKLTTLDQAATLMRSSSRLARPNPAPSSRWPALSLPAVLQAELDAVARRIVLDIQGGVFDDCEDPAEMMSRIDDQASDDFNRAMSEGMNMDLFRTAAHGFIGSALLCARIGEYFGGDPEIRCDEVMGLLNAAEAFGNAEDYAEAAMLAELALDRLGHIYKTPINGIAVSPNDKIDSTGRTARKLEYDLNDFAATAWINVVMNSPFIQADDVEKLLKGELTKSEAYLRTILSRGIIAAYRGRSQYRHNRLFALYGISASAFSRNGNEQAAVFDWLRAIESLTRPKKSIGWIEWMQINGYARNVVSAMEFNTTIRPRSIRRSAERLDRLSSLIAHAQQTRINGGKSGWLLYDIDRNDKRFLQKAVETAT